MFANVWLSCFPPREISEENYRIFKKAEVCRAVAVQYKSPQWRNRLLNWMWEIGIDRQRM